MGYRVDVKRGPLPIMSLDEARQRIQKLHEVAAIRCGYKHTAESIADENRPPPYSQVYPIMFPDGPLRATRREPHTRRFAARIVDYLWHTDLHELKAETDKSPGTRDVLYMMSFIDDRPVHCALGIADQ
jgi:hypothetical protein